MYNILEFLGVFSRKTLALRLENGQVLSNDALPEFNNIMVGSGKKIRFTFLIWTNFFP